MDYYNTLEGFTSPSTAIILEVLVKMPVERNLITFVCTANTCRSPMAEALLKHALQAEDEPLHSLTVVSTGVSSFAGEPPAINTIKVLEEVGITLKDFKSQQLTYPIVKRSFAIFCMTESHRVTVEMSFENCPPHLYLMRELMENTQEYTIPDPYGLNIDAYRACRDSMVESIPSILKFLKKEYLPLAQKA